MSIKLHQAVTLLIVLILIFPALYYSFGFDLLDVTGSKRKKIIAGIPELVRRYSLDYRPGGTDYLQGDLVLKKDGYKIDIYPDFNRVQVVFDDSLGIYLDSKEGYNNSSWPDKKIPLEFFEETINSFFPVKFSGSNIDRVKLVKNVIFTTEMANFIETWQGRKLHGVSFQGDILNITFSYSGYLPLTLMNDVIPRLERMANSMVDIPEQKG